MHNLLGPSDPKLTHSIPRRPSFLIGRFSKTFFFVSNYVLVHGIVNIRKESDVNVAYEKLLRDLALIANDLSEFMFGLCQSHLPKIHRRRGIGPHRRCEDR
jgi:hypothetical protein